MRKIDSIVIHCSATREGTDYTAADIDRWHRARGFNSIGYHFVIRLDGLVEKGRDISLVGAHCVQQRMNHRSIGICYIGGIDTTGNPKDTRTDAQRASLSQLVNELRDTHGIPSSRIFGHNEFAPKACPCFDVKTEFRHE